MRLAERLYVIGSGEFLLTDNVAARPFYDSHVYVLDGGTELALIDAGYGGTVDQMSANAEREGLDLSRLRWCLLTHAHHDHARGAAEWRMKWGVQVCGTGAIADALSKADIRTLAYSCPDGDFPPCEVGRVWTRDGESLRVGDLEVRIWMLRGHSGSDVVYEVCLGSQRVLFMGDLVQCNGVETDLGYPYDVDNDLVAQAVSLHRMYQRRPDVLLPGHGMVAMTHGYRWLGKALHAMRKEGVRG